MASTGSNVGFDDDGMIVSGTSEAGIGVATGASRGSLTTVRGDGVIAYPLHDLELEVPTNEEVHILMEAGNLVADSLLFSPAVSVVGGVAITGATVYCWQGCSHARFRRRCLNDTDGCGCEFRHGRYGHGGNENRRSWGPLWAYYKKR